MKNEFIELMKSRRSVRSYKSEMPSKEAIEQIVEAGEFAPTGRGAQSPIIVAVTKPETRDLLSKLNAEVMGADFDPFYGAPVVLAVLADRNMPTHIYDGSLVMGNMLNAAHALGLGSCWIHRAKEIFESEAGQNLLAQWGIEGDYEGIGFCVVGYANGNAEGSPKPRKPHYVTYVK